MIKGKLHFIVGLSVGILMATIFFNYYAPRYRTMEFGHTLIKQDKWTGDSWRMADGQWKKMLNKEQKWQQVDQTLRTALQISNDGFDAMNALKLLKDKYPVLGEITDDELLERIKIVYSKEVLYNLYLNNFLKSQNSVSEKPVVEK